MDEIERSDLYLDLVPKERSILLQLPVKFRKVEKWRSCYCGAVYLTKKSHVIGLKLDEMPTFQYIPKIILKLHHLTHLEIEGVGLEDPESLSLLTEIPKLEWLNLDCKTLRGLPKSLSKCHNLKYLSIDFYPSYHQDNPIELPADIGDLSNLEFFELLGYHSPIPRSIGNFAKLKEFRLNFFEYPSLPDTIGNFHQLETFYSLKSKFTTFPESIGGWGKLKLLDIWDTPIESLPESFGNLHALEKMEISNSKLKALPESFGGCQALKILTIRDSLLEYIPESFGNLVNLERLLIRFSKLTRLPESIGGLQSLSYMRVSDNCLKSLPESLGNIKSLMELDLTNNYITRIPGSFRNLGKSIDVDLEGNQIHSLYGIAEMIRADNIGFVDFSLNNIEFLPPTAKKLLLKERGEINPDDSILFGRSITPETRDHYPTIEEIKEFDPNYDENNWSRRMLKPSQPLWQYYALPLEKLLEKFIEDRSALTNNELERILYECDERDLEWLKNRTSADDPFIESIRDYLRFLSMRKPIKRAKYPYRDALLDTLENDEYLGKIKGKNQIVWSQKDYKSINIPEIEQKGLADLCNRFRRYIPVFIEESGLKENQFDNKNLECYAIAQRKKKNNFELHVVYLDIFHVYLNEFPPEIFNFSYLDELFFNSGHLEKCPLKYVKYLGGYFETMLQYIKQYKRDDNVGIDQIRNAIQSNKIFKVETHIPEVINQNKRSILELCDSMHNEASKYYQDLFSKEIIDEELIYPEEAFWIKKLFEEIGQEIPIINEKIIGPNLLDVWGYDGDGLDSPYIVINDYVSKITLAGLHLKTVPEALSHFIHIIWLNFRDNEITTLPNSLSQLKELSEIVLEGNKFIDYPPVIGSFKKLDIDSYPLQNLLEKQFNKIIDDFFYGYNYTEFLRERYEISIWKIEDSINRIKNDKKPTTADANQIKLLDYSHQLNKILRTKDKTITDEKKLENIKMWHDVLYNHRLLKILEKEIGRNIPSLFSLNPEVCFYFDYDIDFELSLKDCNLHKIPSQIFKFKHLSELILDNNPINEIPIEILNLKDLIFLNIDFPLIKELPIFMFSTDFEVERYFNDSNLNEIDKQVFSKLDPLGSNSFLQEYYSKWSSTSFLQRMKDNNLATSIDKTFPELLKIRKNLEKELKKIHTHAAEKFLKYLSELSKNKLLQSVFKSIPEQISK